MDSDQQEDPVHRTARPDNEAGAVGGSASGFDVTARPDNEAGAVGGSASGFDVTADRLEQLMKSMEVLLSEVEQLRDVCSHQATELVASATELRQQQEDLKESYAGLGRDMQEVVDTVEELLSTQSSIQLKEKQTEKLSRQL